MDGERRTALRADKEPEAPAVGDGDRLALRSVFTPGRDRLREAAPPLEITLGVDEFSEEAPLPPPPVSGVKDAIAEQEKRGESS